MKLLKIFLIVLCLGVATPALAHNPRIVDKDVGVTEITNPDVSQAFYGELNGAPDLFTISLKNKTDLYVQILVPGIKDIKKDKMVRIDYTDTAKNFSTFGELDGKNYAWRPFFEDFAGDNYFEGPSLEKSAAPGEYTLAVYSSDYKGKYTLVVGRKEVWMPAEIINTILTLPTLKKDFFEKSPWTAYFNLTGLFILGVLLALMIMYFTIASILQKIFGKKNKIGELNEIRPLDETNKTNENNFPPLAG
jgi:hypothetical protein